MRDVESEESMRAPRPRCVMVPGRFSNSYLGVCINYLPVQCQRSAQRLHTLVMIL